MQAPSQPQPPIRLRLPQLPTHVVLNPMLVFAIRVAHRQTPARTLAQHLKCHPSTVCRARRGTTWAWVGGVAGATNA
jgi:hypothetical protein